MPDNNTDQIPPFDRSILAEVAKRLPEGPSKEYLDKLNILMQTEKDDPILAAAVVMGAFSVILGKVPEQVEKVLKSFEGNHKGKLDLGRLETRIGALDIRCKEVNQDMTSFGVEMRSARGDLKSFLAYLDADRKSRDQQSDSFVAVLQRTSSVMKWLIVIAAMQFLGNAGLLCWLWMSSH